MAWWSKHDGRPDEVGSLGEAPSPTSKADTMPNLINCGTLCACFLITEPSRSLAYASGPDIRRQDEPSGELPEEEVMKNLHTLQSLIDTFPEHGDRPALLSLHKA